jgi:nitrite reductase/ring-hydroxylating ferredoxin subunit
MVEKIWVLHIDLAVLGYQVASVLFVVGFLYHFVAWLRYPPNRILWERSAQAFQHHGRWANLATMIRSLITRLLLQTFIIRRGWLRWFTHFAIFWGIVVVSGVCFPLAWGWMSFSLVDQKTYCASMFDLPLLTFRVDSVVAFLAFNAINLGALLLLLGLILAIWQRFTMRPQETAERLREHLDPLYILLAVTVSGLLLTVSYKFFDGIGHRQLAVLHEVTVVLGLLWVPFGKLFHIAVSPATVLLDVAEGAGLVEPSLCSECGKTFSGVWTPKDLREALASADVQLTGDSADVTVLSLCPSCRRHRFAAVLLSGIEGQVTADTVDRQRLGEEHRAVSGAQREQNEQCRSDERLFAGLSLDSVGDVVVNRRGLLSLLLTCSVALFLATVPFAQRFVGRREERFPKVILGRVSDLLPGEARPFLYPGKDNPALLVHLANGEWRAYGGMCTHLGCVVYWDTTSGKLHCPCHNATFAGETGAVLIGPPRHSLPGIDLSVEGNTIYAVRMKA